jgi:Methyltransferase domain
MESVMRRLARADQAGSFSNRRRSRRFEAFERLVAGLETDRDQPVSILDIGGTNNFWEQRGWAEREDTRIVTVNLAAEPRKHENIEPRVGDATDLHDYADGSFDVVFSNSVIEHLRTFEAQRAMAREVHRLAARHWIQTPNYWFPIEPHYLTPAWHYLPEGVRVALLRRRRFGWRGPCPDEAQARRLVQEIRLMRRRELVALFPQSRIVEERFGPLVKSFVAVLN